MKGVLTAILFCTAVCAKGGDEESMVQMRHSEDPTDEFEPQWYWGTADVYFRRYPGEACQWPSNANKRVNMAYGGGNLRNQKVTVTDRTVRFHTGSRFYPDKVWHVASGKQPWFVLRVFWVPHNPKALISLHRTEDNETWELLDSHWVVKHDELVTPSYWRLESEETTQHYSLNYEMNWGAWGGQRRSVYISPTRCSWEFYARHTQLVTYQGNYDPKPSNQETMYTSPPIPRLTATATAGLATILPPVTTPQPRESNYYWGEVFIYLGMLRSGECLQDSHDGRAYVRFGNPSNNSGLNWRIEMSAFNLSLHSGNFKQTDEVYVTPKGTHPSFLLRIEYTPYQQQAGIFLYKTYDNETWDLLTSHSAQKGTDIAEVGQYSYKRGDKSSIYPLVWGSKRTLAVKSTPYTSTRCIWSVLPRYTEIEAYNGNKTSMPSNWEIFGDTDEHFFPEYVSTTTTTTPLTTTPAPQASANGDPHIMNVRGKRFDVYATGDLQMVRIPRSAGGLQADFMVQATLSKVDSKPCAPTIMTRIDISGTSFGPHKMILRPGQHVLTVAVDGHLAPSGSWPRGTRTVHWTTDSLGRVLVSYGALTTVFTQENSARFGYKFVNIAVKGLAKFGEEAGGVLGLDNYEEDSAASSGCQAVHLSRRRLADTAVASTAVALA